MAVGTAVAEGDRSTPATRGELMSVKHDLQMGMKDLQMEMKGMRVEMKDVQLGIFRMIWIAVGALTAVGVLLRFF